MSDPDREHPHWCLCSECADARADFEEEQFNDMARELAAARLALLNMTTDRDAAHAEVAELRTRRTVTMAQALGVTTTTKIGMLP